MGVLKNFTANPCLVHRTASRSAVHSRVPAQSAAHRSRKGRSEQLKGKEHGYTRLKGRILPASTLVETIIASVIFLCVFTISLETVSRLTTKKNDSMILVEVDYRVKQCRREFTAGRHGTGCYTREYQWGRITVDLRPYRRYEALRELTITAEITDSAKRLKYKYVFETDETPQYI